MTVVGIGFVAGLGLLHLFIGRLRLIEKISGRRWLSFGAGVSLAYVFVDVLPILNQGHAVLAQNADEGLQVVKYPVYLVSLFGIAVFFSLEVLAKRSRADNRRMDAQDCTSPGVFWVHIGSFALYNGLLGYLLSEAEHRGVLPCALLFFALMLHFLVNDHALRSHHKRLYDRFGRWLLALAVVAGYVVGTSYMLNESGIAVLWAFVAGGLILNVIKDELPAHRETSLGAFLLGSSAYAALLLAVAH